MNWNLFQYPLLLNNYLRFINYLQNIKNQSFSLTNIQFFYLSILGLTQVSSLEIKSFEIFLRSRFSIHIGLQFQSSAQRSEAQNCFSKWNSCNKFRKFYFIVLQNILKNSFFPPSLPEYILFGIHLIAPHRSFSVRQIPHRFFNHVLQKEWKTSLISFPIIYFCTCIFQKMFLPGFHNAPNIGNCYFQWSPSPTVTSFSQDQLINFFYNLLHGVRVQ